MDELTLATVDSPDCPVSEHIAIFLASGDAPEIPIDSREVSSFSEGLALLENGELDMLAMPARLLHGRQAEMLAADCEVVGARAPRRPNLILVSENSIDYQRKSAVILSESKLVRRQLRRARRGLRVLGPRAYAAIAGLSSPPDDPVSLATWMEGLTRTGSCSDPVAAEEYYASGEIDGYITSRPVYDELRLGSRRRSLIPDPEGRSPVHYLPLPYADLVILIARRRFPVSISEQITELEGDTVWWVQNHLIAGLNEEMLERTGVLVRHRQVGSLMKQAEETKDITLLQSFQDTEGEVIDDDVHVEVRLEVLSNNGHRTLSLERVIAYSQYQHGIISLLRDWEVLLLEASREVPKDFYDPYRAESRRRTAAFNAAHTWSDKHAADTRGNKLLNLSQFISGVDVLGIDYEDADTLREYFHAADENEDGLIHLDQFLMALETMAAEGLYNDVEVPAYIDLSE